MHVLGRYNTTLHFDCKWFPAILLVLMVCVVIGSDNETDIQ